MKLHIAKGLELPLDVVTQKLAFLGRTGSGKTYAAMKLAELMLEHDAQVIALDPVGVWHGLRLGPNPFDVPVFGGLHGDIPLEPGAGALIADTIVNLRISAVLDISQMVGGEPAKFATAFAERLFQRVKAKPSALHLFLEECQEIIPQNPTKGLGQERMLHEFHRLVKIGRNFGIGVSLISQRPQEVNKKALNQTECLFAFQMTGPQERKTLEWWVKDKGVDDDVSATLPKLEVGQCHVWSPQWLKFRGVVRIQKKRTADVSSTPTVGGTSTRAVKLSPIELKQLEQDMSAAIERAKADDPRELRKQIAELKRQLSAQGKQVEVQRVEVPVLDEAALNALQEVCHGELSNLSGALSTAQSVIAEAIRESRKRCKFAVALGERVVAKKRDVVIRGITQHATLRARPANNAPNGSSQLKTMHRAMLTALAQHPDGLTKRQVLIHTGYASSGPVSTAFADLGREGYVESDGNRLAITRDGLKELGSFEPLPLGDDLREWLLGGDKLSKMERALLKEVCAAYPSAVSKGDVLQRAGYASSGPVSTAFAKLVAYGYAVSQGASMLKATEDLFS